MHTTLSIQKFCIFWKVLEDPVEERPLAGGRRPTKDQRPEARGRPKALHATQHAQNKNVQAYITCRYINHRLHRYYTENAFSKMSKKMSKQNAIPCML
jgi:hypothetical protein